ncbi:hypothetical protein HPB48_019263 [Haemaphysalis longicornis]|uniref:Uncharacterized protein n=1 Tax=Haemaphysalis longicornis TaxID=44386 RepID=A0A9J6GF20_HAELO|nr:hypothetical protein HPB48_019263 [Haemaphysalis longicornis]
MESQIRALDMPTSAENTMEFDAQSGQTLPPPGPWQTILRQRSTLKRPQANLPQQLMPRKPSSLLRSTPAPRPDYPTPITRLFFDHELTTSSCLV